MRAHTAPRSQSNPRTSSINITTNCGSNEFKLGVLKAKVNATFLSTIDNQAKLYSWSKLPPTS